MTRPLRVLAVTSEPPWPLNSGGHIRSFHLIRALAAGTELRLICPVRPDQFDTIEPLQTRGISVIPVAVGPRTKLAEANRLLRAMLHGEPYVMYRRHSWRAMQTEWHARKEPPADLWYFDHLDSYMYHTRGCIHPPAVIDLHNIYSLLLERTASEQSHPVKRAFLHREARLLARMEQRAVRECAATFAVSAQEATHFRELGAKCVHVVPNGVDCNAFASLPTGRDACLPTVLFLGTMSWGPNASAARFLADLAPALQKRVPGAKVQIVGRDPPGDLLAKHGTPGVEVTGGVPDVAPYLRESRVMAVPLDSGGGTRLKILEAFASGLPVVSTRIGAEGIDATPNQHLILAERPQFIEALVLALTSPNTTALAARELARTTYDWTGIGREALARVRQIATPGGA